MKNSLIIIVSLLLSSCIYDPPPSFLSIINTKDQCFKVVLKIDTVQSLSGYDVPYYIEKSLLNKDTLELTVPGAYGWKEIMSRNKKNNLYLFITSGDSLVREKNKEFKVTAYTKEQLENLDWTIKIK